MYPKNLCFYFLPKVETESSGEYWTFGSNEGRGCESSHGWCPSQEPLNSSFWKLNNPTNIFTKRCITVTISKAVVTSYGFEDEICTRLLPYICEVHFLHLVVNVQSLREKLV